MDVAGHGMEAGVARVRGFLSRTTRGFAEFFENASRQEQPISGDPALSTILQSPDRGRGGTREGIIGVHAPQLRAFAFVPGAAGILGEFSTHQTLGLLGGFTRFWAAFMRPAAGTAHLPESVPLSARAQSK